MTTSGTNSITSDNVWRSSSASVSFNHADHTIPVSNLQRLGLTSSNNNVPIEVGSCAEVAEVERVERILTPLCLTVVTLSNITLLLHEARVIWRTRKLIPPKFLVLVLCSSDLLASVLGFFPLWVLFVLHSDVADSDPSHTDLQSNRSRSALPKEFLTTPTTVSPWEETTEVSATDNGSHFEGHEVVNTTVYFVFVFLLTSFWTLAQCTVVVMGIERLLAVRAPYFYAARCTCLAFLVVVGVLTLLSCGIGGFHLAEHLAEVNDHRLVFAGFLDSRSLAYNVFTLVKGLVWTVVLILCNWAVTRELKRMEQCVTVMRMKDQNDYMKQLSMVHGAGREFARFMMAVNILFLLSLCPFLICVVLRLANKAPSFSVQYFCWRMSHISALLNPFLYGFLRKSLRSRIRRFLNQHVPCMRPQTVVDDSQEPGPSVRYDNRDSQHNATPNSAIMPRDPEASLVHFSE